MKAIIFILSIVLCSCKGVDNDLLELSNEKWNKIVSSGATLAGISNMGTYLFSEYDNSNLAVDVLKIYSNSEELLEYQIEESIINYLQDRKSRLINKIIDTSINIAFISDTLSLRENYFILSEPFRINSELICFSLLTRINANMNHHFLFFCSDADKGMSIIAYYDFKKEMYFKATKP
jgi:hypothetical protein